MLSAASRKNESGGIYHGKENFDHQYQREKKQQRSSEIVNMSVDESILDDDGNISVDKLQPIMFDSIGKLIGSLEKL